MGEKWACALFLGGVEPAQVTGSNRVKPTVVIQQELTSPIAQKAFENVHIFRSNQASSYCSIQAKGGGRRGPGN